MMYGFVVTISCKEAVKDAKVQGNREVNKNRSDKMEIKRGKATTFIVFTASPRGREPIVPLAGA